MTVFRARPGLVDLARVLVRCGIASRRDWISELPTPPGLVERAVSRTVRHLSRCLPDLLSVGGFLRSWSDFRDEMGEESPPHDSRWVLGIDCRETCRIRVRRVIAALGERQAAAVLHALFRHTPLATGDAGDLEWIIDGWACCEEESEEGEEIRHRAREAAALGEQLDHFRRRGISARSDAIPPGRIRRLLELLAALDRVRSPINEVAWAEADGAGWAPTPPAIHLVWDDDCALSHALDEAEHLNAQDSSPCMPQYMWLLDPADPSACHLAWARWVHTLRQVRTTARVVAALESPSTE
ncbi:hypothetical protein [Longimicrobium terrae]|uniref:Uncharacterized protein n=1 Tax=Longimicrobium terrae TaxID=1639882 RepID=A0A841GNF7_9BACT|nr:hypothetical protein [Longimicrobium terrae]MBB4635955.1 hypothetical protein [Longimicrobium terrae]MBB6070351.1 hypothetical protein [Longimicrobium terrae]